MTRESRKKLLRNSISITLKTTIISKFNETLWCDTKLEDKRKLRYYKEMTNPNLEDQKYLSILTSVEKKISVAKIRINSQELHSETVH